MVVPYETSRSLEPVALTPLPASSLLSDDISYRNAANPLGTINNKFHRVGRTGFRSRRRKISLIKIFPLKIYVDKKLSACASVAGPKVGFSSSANHRQSEPFATLVHLILCTYIFLIPSNLSFRPTEMRPRQFDSPPSAV